MHPLGVGIPEDQNVPHGHDQAYVISSRGLELPITLGGGGGWKGGLPGASASWIAATSSAPMRIFAILHDHIFFYATDFLDHYLF